MPECPYCGKWFRSKKGLRQHISKSHTTEGVFGERVFDPSSVDIFGAIERRQKRAQRRLKRKKRDWLF